MWHPCFYSEQESDKIVHNSIAINCKPENIDNNIISSKPNMIITGPNAGGKSTFIKTLLTNIIFSQTLGIAFAEKVVLTPFYFLNTYLHIHDTEGKESLFQTEVRRCKEHLDMVESLPNDKFTLTIFDEIFSSTNYREGLAGAKAFCKHIAKFPNSISIITTHYTKLGTLSKKNNFTNLHFDANEEEDKITFNYKIKKGSSSQYIALKLMKLNGFGGKMIEDAIKSVQKK